MSFFRPFVLSWLIIFGHKNDFIIVAFASFRAKMGNLCSCMQKGTPRRGDQNHRRDPSNGTRSDTSASSTQMGQNTGPGTQHIKDREDIAPEGEKENNPADVPTVPPKFKAKSMININEDNRHSGSSNHVRASSTSHIFIDDSTVSKPNQKAMQKCLALAIYYHVKSNKNQDSEDSQIPDIFDEKIHPLKRIKKNKEDENDQNDDLVSIGIPDHRDVYKFVRQLFTQAQLAAEVAMVTLIYLERLLTYAEVDFSAKNWKRLTLGAIMLASKVWDDQAVWNVDFCMIIEADVEDLNTLERSFLELLQFNVNVPGSVYAKYYFDLREMAVKYGIKFPSSLLTFDRAVKLEASSKLKVPARQRTAKTSYQVPKHRKCFSLDFSSNANVGRSRWVIS